jgi:hypothetical protein
VYLPVSEIYKGKQGYWDALNAALASPELPAFVDHLQSRNLALFDPTRRPSSNALIDQRVKSLTGFDQWWYSVLQTGETSLGNGSNLLSHALVELDATTPVFVSSSDLIQLYQNFAKTHGLREKSIDQAALRARLQTLCPFAKYTRKQQAGKMPRGYDIPALPKARSAFENFIGGELEWLL